MSPTLIADYVHDLCAAEGIEPCFDALVRAVERLGFEGIVYNGISIPTMSTAEQIAGTNVISSETNMSFQHLLAQRLEVLRNLIRLFQDRVQADRKCRKTPLLPLIEELSDKERKVLKFMATGLPLKVIEDRFGIDPGYAKNLVAGLYDKLGVRNGHQLRYLLGLYGILDAL